MLELIIIEIGDMSGIIDGIRVANTIIKERSRWKDELR